jgi:cobalt/nickel transport system ATP-binding protein
MNAIRTIGLEHIYADGTIALQGVDFEARTGEKIAVLGPNGSGKSTLFFHFNGLIKPTGGEVQVFGENISKDNMEGIRKRVGLVFQDPESQLFAPTVYEDIAFGPRNLRLGSSEIKDRVNEMLHRFDIEDLAHKNPSNLSGGQKKRVAIAGVAAMEPDILVVDEPTGGLDSSGITGTMELLDELNHEGKTVIISTHDTDLAASWADRVYVLNKGKVFASGAPCRILADEKTISEAGLKHPVIVQTFREFRARGISRGETPLSVLELMDSVDVNVMTIRCAVAACDLLAGEEVFLAMKDGMLVADKGRNGMKGNVVSNARKGDDIAVRDVVGDMNRFSGSVVVIRVPGIIEGGSRAVDIKRAGDILEKNRPDKIGAMGTSAKVLMKKMGTKCDFEFDVVQSGLLAALRGFNVAIFASGRMAEIAERRVREKNIHLINCEL